MERIIKFLLSFLLLLCIFDPADKLLRLKVPVFLLTILMLIIKSYLEKKRIYSTIFLYVVIFSFVLPSVSIANAFIFEGSTNLNPIKAYLFLIMALFISDYCDFIIKKLAFYLTLLSVIMILISLLIKIPFIFLVLKTFGQAYTIFELSPAVSLFGDGIVIRIYFWTAPLLIFSVTYFLYRTINSSGKSKIYFFFLFIINWIGFFLSGSRANVLMCFISIYFVLFTYLKYKNRLILIASTFILAVLSSAFISTFLNHLFSLKDKSNHIKYSYISDYFDIYTLNIKNLLFGQGLGSSFYLSVVKSDMTYSELTYFELFRNFGFIFGLVYIFLILWPFYYFKCLRKEYRWLLIAYLLYIVMAFFNPFFFSSTGMILLSLVISTTFSNRFAL